MSVISVPGMLRQEGNEVEANLGYRANMMPGWAI